MASVASPYGLRPSRMIGARHASHGMREFKLPANNTAAIFTGDVIQLANGAPSSLTATPVAGTTAGIVGVCVGVRYRMPSGTSLGYSLWSQMLPANAITNLAYDNIYIEVVDDPDVVWQIQGSAAFGSLTNGADGAIGKNFALGNFSAGSTTSGLSGVNAVVGTNGASLATTATLAMRVVAVVPGTENDAFPELLCKFNFGVHSYQFATGA